jgi:ankyrin repeat protein
MAYSEFHTAEFDCEPDVFDTDGTALYEEGCNGLLRTIIKRNDMDKLKQYVLSSSRHFLSHPVDLTYDDVFWMAASYGSTDAFRFLLEQYNAVQADKTPLNQRGFSLLHAACRTANVDVARLFLDSQPPLGTISARDEEDETPLLSAASSLLFLPVEGTDEIAERHERILHSEQLLNLLLDRGACAQDSRHPYPNSDIVETVLGMAVSRGSSALVKRLLDQGADPYIKQHLFNDPPVMGAGQHYGLLQDASVLHLAAIFWNTDAIKALIDHHPTSFPDLVSSRDSHGHLPLHYAAGRRCIEECEFPDDEISSRLVETFRFLLSANPSAINARDEHGMTPLYHTINTHAYCVGSRHAELTVRVLLEHGADAAIPDSSGRTTLHLLAKSPEPIGTVLLDLLIAHGADANHADNDGNKPLHDMTMNLRQTQATSFLCSKGADISATNAHGDTAFHKAAGGNMTPQKSLKERKYKPLTPAVKISAQDEIMAVLQTAFGGDEMMNQPNNAGKTPRDLQAETRSRWQAPRGASRGRGRGYTRG